MNNITKNLILATRPKTLPAGIAPVIMATSYASNFNKIEPVTTTLIFICTILLQASSNLINDYYDSKSGVDKEDRLGPVRATSVGALSPKVVKTAFISCLLASFILGLFLMKLGGLPIIIAGFASILFAYLYTGGPLPLSHIALGELLALVFFGIVAVTGTFYLHTSQVNLEVFILGLIPGFISCAIMSINNARDIANDKKANKITLAILVNKISPRLSQTLPLIFIIMSITSTIAFAIMIDKKLIIATSVILTALFSKNWLRIRYEDPSPHYNIYLANTGKFLFLLSIIMGLQIWKY